MPSWEHYLGKFEKTLLTQRGLSQNTITAYLSDLNLYFSFIKQKRDAKPSSEIFQEKYLAGYIEVQKREGRASRSINRFISTIRSFMKYLFALDVLSTLTPLPALPKTGSYFPYFLSESEMSWIFSYMKSSHTKTRDYLIIKVLYALGLRVSELINLRHMDIAWQDELVLIKGKGSRERLVPLHKSLKEDLYAFSNESMHRCEYLFLNKSGRPLSRVFIWKLVKKICLSAQIKRNIHPHTFRHTFATHMLNRGANLRVLQELLGHSDIKTTQIYTHLSSDDLKNAFKAYHPMWK